MSDLGSLGASFRGAREALGKAQGAAGLARDRGDEALRLLAQVSDGSDDASITAALASVAEADDALDKVIGMYVSAAEQIAQYVSRKNIP